MTTENSERLVRATTGMRRGGGRRVALLVLGLAVLGGCGDGGGGSSGTSSDIFAALGEPIPSSSSEQLATFERGRQVALHRFTAAEGLGRDFNATSCAACHEKPTTGGSAGRYRNFLLVRAVLEDGSSINTGVSGVQPQFTLNPGGRRATDAATNLEVTRNPIPFFGVGLLAEIPEAEILKRVDEGDADGDGISGRANYDRGFVGRLGRKAQTVSVEGFIRGPLFNHVGITTNPLSDEMKNRLPVPSGAPGAGPAALAWLTLVRPVHAQVAAPEEPLTDNDGVPDPEMSEQDLFDLVSFAMLTAAPRPDEPTATTEEGSRLFEQVGCTGCHVRALVGPRGPIPAYTDLLLHDMGAQLDDGIQMGLAFGSEFRTQPLWGVGAEAPYLHDGRADTLDQAIRLHGGEGQRSRDAYVALTSLEREEIIAFLNSLGGSSQKSDGLLAPGEPIPAVGALGGPVSALSATERATFLEGRALFDRDVAIATGLGPNFNGDSCRACHFLPVIGGAGPADVDVTRQGHLEDGVFTAPASGTMASRNSTSGTRPPIDPSSNTFETRETPSILGLGFLESIPDAAILANDDCDNPDPTAISGCARVLPTGQLGRFGWKAGVPTLEEFARDALSNENGLTVPALVGRTFGNVSDNDGAPDPEISADEIAAMTFFMRQLAPPRGHSTDAAAEARGDALFEEVGCASCHVSTFVAPGGIVAYTDLLLHQVAPDGSAGIADGSAGPLEFRTPPLWGIALTPPYMHDGRSFSIEDAIARHDAEAAGSRQAYVALSPGEKADLLAFLASL